MTALWSAGDIAKALVSAKPEVQKLGLDVFLKTYAAVPDPIMAPGGANLASASRIIKGAVSEWIKTLPGGSDAVLKMPKMTSAWAASRKASDMYVYSGAFTPNPVLMGKWQTVATAKSVEDYQAQLAQQAEEDAKAAAAAANPKAKKPAPKQPPPKFGISGIALQAGGNVGGVKGFVWSGGMLINSGSQEALKMEIKTLLGKEYLFVEAGGFSVQKETVEDEVPWNASYFVMERGK